MPTSAFITFCLIGGGMTLVNFALFYVLHEMGVYYLAANIISTFIVLCISYYLHVLLTFRATSDAASVRSLWRYLIVRLVLLAVGNMLLYFLVDLCLFNVYLALLLTTVTMTLMTYGFTIKILHTPKS